MPSTGRSARWVAPRLSASASRGPRRPARIRPENSSILTRRPGSSDETPGPSAPTIPTISWPGTIGRRMSGSSPSTIWRSVRQTPQASTSRRSSPGPGCGRGRSSSRNACPGDGSTIALTAAILPVRKNGRERTLMLSSSCCRSPQRGEALATCRLRAPSRLGGKRPRPAWRRSLLRRDGSSAPLPRRPHQV